MCFSVSACHHYENAFASYLGGHNVTSVSVNEAKARVPGRLNVKTFDYVVYPGRQRPALIDVKGRKFPSSTKPGRRRWENWVTQDDLDGLTEWQRLFGGEFDAAFVFAYWLPDATPPLVCDPDYFVMAGRTYTFWGIMLHSYLEHARVRSPRWRTVYMPADRFSELAWPLTRWVA